MDPNLLSGLIGVGGTILGVGVGSYIQYIFRKHDEKKEIKRHLISLKAQFDGHSMKVENALVNLEIHSCYNSYIKAKHNLYVQLYKSDSNAQALEQSRLEYNEANGKYYDLDNTLFQILSEFSSYVTEKSVFDEIQRHWSGAREYDKSIIKYRKMEIGELEKRIEENELEKITRTVNEEYMRKHLLPISDIMHQYIHTNYIN